MPIEKGDIAEEIQSLHDRDLVIRLIKNDQDAFCELYARYKDRLLYFALKFVKSREFAEDIYQDTFAVIWQSRKFLDPDKNFSSYLYTIVKNRILNILRDIEKEQKLKSIILTNSIDYSDSTNQYLQTNELNKILVKALETLTPRQRQIFEMSRDQQMTHKEIAEALNISVYTVQEHISIALKTIKHYLGKYPDYLVDFLLILICLNS